MKIRPLQDRVLVRRLDAETTTPGGLIIPENAKEKPTRGVVVAVGNGRVLDSGKLLPPSVKEGDEVLFTKYGGQDVHLDGDELLIVRDHDLLGVFDE